MKKRILCLLMCAVLLLPGCAQEEKLTRYTHSFFGTFDTFIVLTGYAADEETFQKAAELCESEFKRYHELFTSYIHSDTVNNVYNLNNGAWIEPMSVTEDMMELLLLCKEAQAEIPGTVNIAMGRVLRLWHEAREDAEGDPVNAYLPDWQELEEAALHTSIDDLILDQEAMTVYYADPLLRLDLGSVAKGYAAGKVAEKIAALIPHFSLNAGGNIVVGDGPANELGMWKAGIQEPDAALVSDDDTYVCTIKFNNMSVVTSGDYQRYYVVDGQRYHHIIDPATLWPANYFRAVTILTADSAMADFLSTAAFLLPYEESRAMIEARADTEALWILPDGTVEMTDGFRAYLLEE